MGNDDEVESNGMKPTKKKNKANSEIFILFIFVDRLKCVACTHSFYLLIYITQSVLTRIVL